jgi:mono/diheme cytochrome c family protein
VNVALNNTISFQIPGIPTGAGYVITLDAVSTNGSLTCVGSAAFGLTAGATTPVSLRLVCTGAVADAGNVAVTASTDVCANIDSLGFSASETTVGQPIQFSATASAGTVQPTFAWSASAGTFDSATSATPVFTCPSTPGTVTVSLTVGPGDASCPTVTSQSVTVTCDTVTPTFTNVYADVIGQRCTSCHAPGKSGVTAGMLDMSTPATAYAALVGVAAMGTSAGTSGVTCASLGSGQTDGAPMLLRVAPGDPGDSLVVNKVTTKIAGTASECGSPMPAGAAAPLTEAQVDLITAWIQAGARND